MCTSSAQCEAVGLDADGNAADPIVLGESAGAWSAQDAGLFSAELSGVHCLSSSDCVATGYIFQNVNGFLERHSLVETWDGIQWTSYGGGNLDQGSDYNFVRGIACTSGTQNECIAVGSSKSGTSGTLNMILRGTQPNSGDAWSWQVLSGVPNPGMTNDALQAVSCPSAGLCIAVGSAQTFFQNSGNFNGAEELEGTEVNGNWTWTTIGTDSTGGSLSGLACTTTTSCLAVGSTQDSPVQPLVEAWNGSGAFSQVANPPAPGAGDNSLADISCETASNCTTVGYEDDATSDPTTPLVAQWDGATWHPVQAPSSGTGYARLSSVTCDASSNQCTAVGSDNGSALVDSGPGYVSHTLTASPSGSGSGTITDNAGAVSCPSTCSHDYPAGTTVTLTAAPGAGSVFTGWSGGGCSGTGACTVTMNADTSITATFSQSASAPISSPPTATTLQPVGRIGSAAFSGSVNPQGLATTASFQYGLDLSQRGPGASTTLYDQSTPSQTVGSDSTAHTVTASPTGLIPGALYHVRLVAVNAAGTTFGQDQTFTAVSAAAPPPVLGKSEVVKPVSGKVFIRTRSGQFIPLEAGTQIRTGTVIDALHGSLQLLAALGKGKTDHGIFGGAVFRVTQSRNGLTTLSLVEGLFKGGPTYAICKAHDATDATIASSKTLQLLKASAHGKFSTKGRYSAATVRGTKWTVADRCDGTLTHVITDSVAVTDFVHHKTIILHAGQSYLARIRKPK